MLKLPINAGWPGAFGKIVPLNFRPLNSTAAEADIMIDPVNASDSILLAVS